MDGAWVRRFAREQQATLLQARVQRVVPIAPGLVLVLETASGPMELGIVALPGAAWAWAISPAARTGLLDALVAEDPEWGHVVPELGWLDPAATALDALRAWLLRPDAATGWSVLEGARLTACQALSGDRILEFEFEARDALGDRLPWRLRAELFDRGANALLMRGDGNVVARWRDRAAMQPRAFADAALEPSGAADVAAFTALARAAAATLTGDATRVRRRDIARHRRLLEHLQAEHADAAAAAEHRRTGDLLAANMHRIKRGMDHVVVEDFFAGGALRRIELDPQRTPPDNVADYFRRARRGARGRATIEARLDATRRRLDALTTPERQASTSWCAVVRAQAEAWRAAVPKATLATPVTQWWNPGGPAWTPSRARAATPARSRGPGRSYWLAPGWEARVGRDDADNDALTHRFAHPDDVWLHASGVAGSHVVLRMQGHDGNPPRAILEAAAALAARFSKAKHAGTVPVIWTRKRHVRKPRGGAPGLASCTHEKTIFVRPALPEATEAGNEH
jgi:predicted ribosome quality control (RQC) complex YloA/Tae2 family protein